MITENNQIKELCNLINQELKKYQSKSKEEIDNLFNVLIQQAFICEL